MNDKTRRLTLAAMLGAMAYLLMVAGRIPVVMFLKYDPKDAVIAIGGFLLGPASAALTSIAVSLVEMLTVSDTGPIGLFMNILSTCAFVLPAAWVYRRRHTLNGAVAGLAVGVVFMTCAMLAWNYIVTPLYMGYPRAAVAELLIPVFLPFNLLKGLLNAGVTLLIYKPVSQALRRAKLLPPVKAGAGSGQRYPVLTIACLFVIVTVAVCFYLMHMG